MFGDFNTGPNAPRKRSRVAQGIHIGRRRSISNTHSMRIFGCSIRHSIFARSVVMQTTPLWRRECAGSTVLHPGRPEFIPQRGPGLHPDHPATPDLRHSRTISQRQTCSVPSPMPPRTLCGESENKKSAQIATFLRLRIVMDSSDRGSRRKSAGDRPYSSIFPLRGSGKESAIAKKLQKWRDFCF